MPLSLTVSLGRVCGKYNPVSTNVNHVCRQERSRLTQSQYVPPTKANLIHTYHFIEISILICRILLTYLISMLLASRITWKCAHTRTWDTLLHTYRIFRCRLCAMMHQKRQEATPSVDKTDSPDPLPLNYSWPLTNQYTSPTPHHSPQAALLPRPTLIQTLITIS